MRINSKDIICKIPLIKVRDAMKGGRGNHWVFSNDYLVDCLKINKKQAHDLIIELKSRGYIEKEESQPYRRSKRTYWSLTVKGNGFSMATAAPPTARKNAEKKLSEFLKRVEEINLDPDSAFMVPVVLLFGSYLDKGKDFINDIDIIVEVKHSTEDSTEWQRLCKISVNKAKADGKIFRSWQDRAFWPERQVWHFLKNRSRVYSFHDLDTLSFIEERKLPFEIIYSHKNYEEDISVLKEREKALSFLKVIRGY